MNPNIVIIVLGAYILAFMICNLAVFTFKIRRKGGRPPVEFKLLRGPGESLRRRIKKFDDEFAWRIFLAATLPILLAGIALQGAAAARPQSYLEVWAVLVAPVLVLAGSLVLAGIYLYRSFVRYRNDSLGYLGERHVAELMEPLLREGYSIFHDVPAVGKGTEFNLDHVIVGPTGVALVETKTRRKSKKSPHKRSYTVYANADHLKWPWGRENAELKQTLDQANWLSTFIQGRTGLKTSVAPILALPGWMVEGEVSSGVSVLNPKRLPAVVRHLTGSHMTAGEIDLIHRQLDSFCRTITD